MVTRSERMVASAPGYYHYATTFIKVQEAIAADLENIHTTNEDLRNQLYVQTATWGLKYWEKAVGIVPIEADSYEVRRSRILGLLRGVGNFSADLVHSIASAYTQDVVNVLVDIPNYWVTVEFIEDFPNTKDFKDQLEMIVHAHLGLQYRSKMKAKTQPKTTWKQVVDDFTINMGVHSVPWGFENSETAILMDGKDYDGDPLTFDGSRYFGGDNRRIGPKIITRNALRMAYTHAVQVNQNPAAKIKSGFKHTAFKVNNSHALQIVLKALPTKAVNFDGNYNFDGKTTFGQLFIDRKESFTLQQAFKEPGVQPNHTASNKISVSFPTTLKVDQKPTAQVKMDTYSGTTLFNGREAFDGSRTFGDVLINHSGSLEVYKNGNLVEKAAI